MAVKGGALATIVICALIGVPLALFLVLFLLRKWMHGPTAGSDNEKQLDDKVVVITGANSGIGKVTAHELSKRGAKIIMLCRDLENAEEAADDIRKDTGNVVAVLHLDLSSLESVRKCADELHYEEDKIDILVNNAGVMACPESRTEDGYETQFGVNHLGHFLLTELLMPKLRESARTGFNARIIILASKTHARGNIRWKDLNWSKGHYDKWKAYHQSKLANVMHGAALARRLQNTGISVYIVHPGMVNTNLTRHVKDDLLYRFLHGCQSYIYRSPFYGAQTTLYCCLEEKISHQSGKYYSCCTEKSMSYQAENIAAQEKLWNLSTKLVGINKDLQNVY